MLCEPHRWATYRYCAVPLFFRPTARRAPVYDLFTAESLRRPSCASLLLRPLARRSPLFAAKLRTAIIMARKVGGC